jgi:hypothetical protein
MEYTTKQIIDCVKYLNGKYNVFRRTYQKHLIDLTKNYDGLRFIKLLNILQLLPAIVL